MQGKETETQNKRGNESMNFNERIQIAAAKTWLQRRVILYPFLFDQFFNSFWLRTKGSWFPLLPQCKVALGSNPNQGLTVVSLHVLSVVWVFSSLLLYSINQSDLSVLRYV